jgi:hypothetical protein
VRPAAGAVAAVAGALDLAPVGQPSCAASQADCWRLMYLSPRGPAEPGHVNKPRPGKGESPVNMRWSEPRRDGLLPGKYAGASSCVHMGRPGHWRTPAAGGASLTRVRCRAPLNAVVFRVLQPGPECCFLLPVVPPGRLLGSGSAQSARFRASGRPAPALATRTRVEDSCASLGRAISPRRADAGRLARKK